MTDQTFRPRRFLFATWDGGGNIPPALTAIRALIQRGHEVAVLCDDATAADVRAAGARAMPWRRAPNRPDRTPESDLIRGWEAPSERDELAFVRDRLFVNPAESYARDVIDALDVFDADVVVPNDMLFGAIIGAEAAKRPIAVLAPNLSLFPIAGLPAFGPGFFPATNDGEHERDRQVAAGSRAMLDAALPRFNKARQNLGLEPITSLLDVCDAANRVLLATSRAFDYPLASPPKSFRYIGPLLDRPVWAAGEERNTIPNDPHVLIALSTTFQDQGHALGNAIKAMDGLPFQAIATLGPSLESARFDAPANVKVVSAADHDCLMASARLVVTHAGHGTVMRALRHSLPLVCLPMGRDQHDNAARVAFHGAGLRLDRAESPAAIRAAITAVLGDPKFKLAAKALQDEILAQDSEAQLISELEMLEDSNLGRPKSPGLQTGAIAATVLL